MRTTGARRNRRDGTSAAIVELDNGVESGEAAIVHVRRRARDLAQRRRLEGAAIGIVAGNDESAQIIKRSRLT